MGSGLIVQKRSLALQPAAASFNCKQYWGMVLDYGKPLRLEFPGANDRGPSVPFAMKVFGWILMACVFLSILLENPNISMQPQGPIQVVSYADNNSKRDPAQLVRD